MAFEMNIEHYSRHTPGGGSIGDADIVLFGEDYSDASYVMTFKSSANGSAIITLTNVAAGSQGIFASFDDDYVHPQSGEQGDATIIVPQIDEATMEGLTWADPPSPLVLLYDLLVTPQGGAQRALFYGTFTIQPGVGD